MPAPAAVIFIGCLVVVVPVAGVDMPFPRPSYNEVYTAPPPTNTPLNTPRPHFSASRAKNMSQTTDLRQFIMLYVQDARICSDPTLRDLILAEDSGDEAAKKWWSRRCTMKRPRGGGVTGLPTQSESTLIRYRRKSSNRANPQNSLDRSRSNRSKWDKIQKLMKDKRIKCRPKKSAVPLPNPDRQHTQLLPECVYIKQCGGCCNSPQLECVPVRTKTKTFPAMEFTPASMGLQFGKEQKLYRMVKVVEHRACECECKVRPEHCAPNQEYSEDACQCECPTHISRQCPPRKVWNERECRCECSRQQNCTTGRYFDVNSCRCAEPRYHK